MARREQNAQKQAAAFYGMIANEMARLSSERNMGLVKSLQKNIESLNSARASLLREIESQFPEYAGLISPKAVTVDQTRSLLRPGEALISTWVGNDVSFIWAIPKNGQVAFAMLPVGKKAVYNKQPFCSTEYK